MNVSATLNIFKLLTKPSLCIPHTEFPTFDRIPLPISQALTKVNAGEEPDIRAVVLDKDNCFAKAKENNVHRPYEKYFESFKAAYPDQHLLIVSNSAGTRDDLGGKGAKLLKEATGVSVFPHETKKPGCGSDVYNHLRAIPSLEVSHPSQVVVIGDRLFTDVMMANLMGCWSIWVQDGVVHSNGAFSRFEKELLKRLTRYGFKAPIPKSV